MCLACRLSRRRFATLLGAAPLAAGPTARAGNRLPVIMIDPGHGGHDPGAIAPDGAFEKDITLATGLTLHGILAATGRYHVHMTRSTDEFVTLDRRVAMASEAKANLFLALHCDHLPTAGLRGASVFTLSANASDTLAADLADAQNRADQNTAYGNVPPKVADILASLETRATRLSSATLSDDIRDSFAGIIPLLPDPQRSANFAVLRDPTTPSTLLEMGCLTNPLDEHLLQSPTHRRLIAERLTQAIDLYFSTYSGQRVAG
jgi:N-acetylmuramoyl-L-alanine amidase